MVPLHILRITLAFTVFFTSVSGLCTTPRVRKEWRSISANERACWLKAVSCLAKVPHDPKIAATVDPAVSLISPLNPNSSYYDDFVYIHMDLNVLIHNTGLFFPWHRLYVQTFEDKLRSKCGYNGVHPYWDWTQDTADFYHATIFSDSSFDGLGTWGDPNNDFQISNGGLKDVRLAYPAPHNIRRNFTNSFAQGIVGFLPVPIDAQPVDPSLMANTTFTREVVDAAVNSSTGNFTSFQTVVENYAGHPGPHLIMGGDLGGRCTYGLGPPKCNPGPRWSPNDPMFFLHHAMIDKMWYDWQRRDPSNKKAFEGGSVSWQANLSLPLSQYPTGAPPLLNESSVIPGDGMWKNYMVSDILDTVGGKLCYVYA